MQTVDGATIFKVVLLGEVDVGKTSLFNRLKTGKFDTSPSATATLGVEAFEKDYTIDGSVYRLQIWDTAGSEKYRTLTANYYRGASAVLYVYDLTEEESLFGLVAWLDDAKRYESNHTPILVGNKCDVESEIVLLTESTIQSFNQDNGFEMSLSMSAKSGQGVDASFQEVARVLAQRYASRPVNGASHRGVSLKEDVSEKSSDTDCCS